MNMLKNKKNYIRYETIINNKNYWCSN